MEKLRHFRKLIAFLGFSPLLLQADMTTFFNSIEQQLTSPTAKGILMVIFLGLAIFIWKNLDRWKEILMTVLAIAIGAAIFFKAPALANWFMTSVGN
ncbi:TrbC/VirB2 family protein [Helicobacter pylori]|uniref:VirB2 type IV secretion protein n=1 Tax=Helicobacter pylori NQ4053 TaxID=992027 RepID=J0J5U7_HELPX|nr:TrbC/VirB2 family protein [Helicobacter pylori]EJB33062.1 virB2 type IV secretion protein [Helicobacter pylori NQ4053]